MHSILTQCCLSLLVKGVAGCTAITSMKWNCWSAGSWHCPLEQPGSISVLQWRHNWYDSVSNHQPHDCSLNRLFRRRSKKTSKLRVTGLCAGNSPGTGEFPAQMVNYAENVSIWWPHHRLNKVRANERRRWIGGTHFNWLRSWSAIDR